MLNATRRQAWIDYLLKARNLGPYIITGYRGGGEFGVVFAAVDSRTQREVALKVQIPGAAGLDLLEFEDEGEILRKLGKYSNVLRYFETLEETIEFQSTLGPPLAVPIKYHVMELADGGLDELLTDEYSRTSMKWRDKLSIWRDAIKGIHQMHLKSCVHRDLKSSNFLLFYLPHKKILCKVSDLGKARDLTAPARMSEDLYIYGRGDMRHAAPECLYLQGPADGRGFRLQDLYGLGSLFFEIVTGQGITSVALGYGPDVMRRNLQDLKVGQRTDLSALNQHYDRAMSVLAPELPVAIRNNAVALVRQLCSPVPEERLPRIFGGRRRTNDVGLDWLIRRADILYKSYGASERNRPQRNSEGGPHD